LELPAEIWPRRVEEMLPARKFEAVTMRAVEKMTATIEDATARVNEGGWVAALVGSGIEMSGAEEFLIPQSEHRRLLLWRNVPRGTLAS
jgi:16S rRNA G527 N7-methylase RsmG